MSVFTHPEFRGHEHVAFRCDARSGLRAIIAIHNTQLGPALGGCRMWAYASDDDALTDVLRLARGMTYKSALANLPLGGGKAVIIGDPRRDKSTALLHAMGEFVDSLGGRYITAEDSGTGVADMKIIGARTSYVSGFNVEGEHGGDPSPSTAYGVFVGLQEAVQFALARAHLRGLKVAIQGVGNVGFHLAQHLRAAGAEVYVADIFSAHVERAVCELGAIAVPPETVHALDVDVFAPCALGAIINEKTLPQMRARVIAGAANNQLATPELGQELLRRGITYAPDYVINAGGIIDVAYQREQKSSAAMRSHVEGIAVSLRAIFARSRLEQISTARIADQIAEEKLAAAPCRSVT